MNASISVKVVATDNMLCDIRLAFIFEAFAQIETRQGAQSKVWKVHCIHINKHSAVADIKNDG